MLTLLASATIAAAVLVSQSTSDDKSREIARLADLHQRAVAAQNAGNYEEAERLHRKVVEGMERIPDSPANERARQMSNLASALNLLGRPAEALELLKRAQGLLEKHPSQDPAQDSALHFNLGKSYALQQAWVLAEREYKRGRDILKQAGVSNQLYFFDSDAGLAYVYWKSGRLHEAKSLYEAALRVVHTLVPPTHPIRVQWEQEYQAVVKELGR
jgi:tetratricopeptide (TPR) repeat protein